MDQILENDASEELKTTDIIAGESNEMDKNEDEIHQDTDMPRIISFTYTFQQESNDKKN